MPSTTPPPANGGGEGKRKKKLKPSKATPPPPSLVASPQAFHRLNAVFCQYTTAHGPLDSIDALMVALEMLPVIVPQQYVEFILEYVCLVDEKMLRGGLGFEGFVAVVEGIVNESEKASRVKGGRIRDVVAALREAEDARKQQQSANTLVEGDDANNTSNRSTAFAEADVGCDTLAGYLQEFDLNTDHALNRVGHQVAPSAMSLTEFSPVPLSAITTPNAQSIQAQPQLGEVEDEQLKSSQQLHLSRSQHNLQQTQDVRSLSSSVNSNQLTSVPRVTLGSIGMLCDRAPSGLDALQPSDGDHVEVGGHDDDSMSVSTATEGTPGSSLFGMSLSENPHSALDLTQNSDAFSGRSHMLRSLHQHLAHSNNLNTESDDPINGSGGDGTSKQRKISPSRNRQKEQRTAEEVLRQITQSPGMKRSRRPHIYGKERGPTAQDYLDHVETKYFYFRFTEGDRMRSYGGNYREPAQPMRLRMGERLPEEPWEESDQAAFEVDFAEKWHAYQKRRREEEAEKTRMGPRVPLPKIKEQRDYRHQHEPKAKVKVVESNPDVFVQRVFLRAVDRAISTDRLEPLLKHRKKQKQKQLKVDRFKAKMEHLEKGFTL